MKILFPYFTIVFLLFFGAGCKDDISSNIRTGSEDPRFRYISEHWMPQYNKLVMNEIWQSEGIDRKGYNYYFLPLPIEPYVCSARFIPTSDFFQCWFGMYTVADNGSGTYALNNGGIDETEILKLAIADQRAWLKNFAGLQNPTVLLDGSSVIKNEEITIDFQKGWKLTGRLISNADVGENNNPNLPDILKVDKSIWTEYVDSYQQIYLDVFAYVWYAPENKELNVAYFNGVEFTDRNGTTYRTTEKIFSELEKMVFEITVYQ